MIIAKDLYKSYGKATYLSGVSLNIQKGSALAVVGENGAGKTTLLKILATASAPDSGELYIDGIDSIANPAKAREKIGYVPQGIALMQELCVKDNLYYWMKNKDENIYRQTLETIGLADMEKKRVSALSGGMKRRLNIGASLVISPSLLILDEPLAGVDAANRRKITQSLIDMKKSGMTIIFTSHYNEEISMLADELFAFRDGACAYYGSIDFSGNESFADLSEAIRYFTE